MAAMFWLDAGNNDAAVHKTKLHSRKYMVKLCGKYGWAAFESILLQLTASEIRWTWVRPGVQEFYWICETAKAVPNHHSPLAMQRA